MDFARYAIGKPVNTWVLVLICLFGGIIAFFEIGRLEDPEFTIKEAVVNAQYPGATALDVEQEITEPLESAIQQMSQIKEIRSRSMPGAAEIRVVIQDSYKGGALAQVWNELRNKVADAQGDLPPNVDPPMVNDDFGDVFGIFYALTGDGLSLQELHELGKELRRELLTAEGVAKVEITGQQEERILVKVDQARLAALRLSPEEIIAALGDADAVVDAGGVRAGELFLNIRPSGSFDSLDTLGALPVGQGTQNIQLGDIAQINRDYVERPMQIIRHNGQPALTMGVSGISGSNIVEVGEAVEAKLDSLQHRIPLGAELHPLYQQHTVVNESVNSFALNVFLSVAIVVAVLCIAMHTAADVALGCGAGAYFPGRIDHRHGHAGGQRRRGLRRHADSAAQRPDTAQGSAENPAANPMAAAWRHHHRYSRLRRDRPVPGCHRRVSVFDVLCDRCLPAAELASGAVGRTAVWALSAARQAGKEQLIRTRLRFRFR